MSSQVPEVVVHSFAFSRSTKWRTVFLYEDGQDNLYNEQGEKVYDPMEGILTQISDPNIVLQTITSQQTYLALKPAERIVEEKVAKQPKVVKSNSKVYNDYSDRERERFIDRMIEVPEERSNITMFARELAIDPLTAERWWKSYNKTGEVPYKKSKINSGPKISITAKHEEYIERLIDQDPQLFAEDIIEDLAKQFEDFSISKSRLNHYLKNDMQITIKKPTFEAEIRNFVNNLNTRFE